MVKKFHQRKSKCQHNQNKKRKRHKVRLKRGRKPADPRIKYGVMAGVGVLFLWLASVAPAAFLSPLHCIRIGLCSRLLRGLERQPRFTHPTYGGNQCDFRYHHCGCITAN